MHRKDLVIACLFTLVLSVALSGLAGYFIAKNVYKQDTSNAIDTSVPQKPFESKDEQSSDTESNVDLGKELTVVEVAKRCTKSVVNITVKERKQGYTGGSEYTETVLGHGTGVIMREDGYIVTCHHVIDGADSIYVTFDNNRESKATLVGFDERFDLAVIRVDEKKLPVAEVGDSDEMLAGEGVVIIGNPLGEFGSSVSYGILSTPTRELTIEGVPLRLMQTDAAVNPGNSGGGMFNMRGQWVAMVNAKISASGIEGIAFAIPINTILKNIQSIIDSGESGKTAVLGVSTKKANCHIDGKAVDCLEIASVKKNSAAADAGLKVGDYLLSVDGRKLENNDSLTLVIKYLSAGDKVEFEVYRNKEKFKITVTLK